MEKIALARLPSLAEEEGVVEQKNIVDEETGDGDSAIHLDCLQENAGQFDSSDDVHSPVPHSLPRRLQRSVSDVVGCQMLTSRSKPGVPENCFPSPLYRGFLLRHQRRQKESRDSDPEHLRARESYNVNAGCHNIRHLDSDAKKCSNLGRFEIRSCLESRIFPHQAPTLSIPVVADGEGVGGRAKKKTTIIIGNPSNPLTR